MQINKSTQNNQPNFNATLYLRGNVRGLTAEQTDYLKKVASDIGICKIDKIDIFAHKSSEQKKYALVDIGGYIYDKVKASHTSCVNNNTYNTIVNALKFLIVKMYNNELLMQLENSPDIDEFGTLKEFIKRNKIHIEKTDKKNYISNSKLTIDGHSDMLSEKEISKIADVVNTVAILPYDKFYLYIHPNDRKDRAVINMAGYFNGLLKSAIADYSNANVYNGCMSGIKFAIEKLFGEQIKRTARERLTQEEIYILNQKLQKEKINLQI